MSARTGKIARLPRDLRHEVNRRLERGETAKAIAAWLNTRPEVQEVLAQHFGGRPVNEQNLTEWRQGGYTEWLEKQEFLHHISEVTADAADLKRAAGPVADHAASLLAARYAVALAEWDGDPDHPAASRLKALANISRELIALRRGDHSAARLRMEQQRHDEESQSAEETNEFEIRKILTVQFEKLLQTPEIKRLMETGMATTEQRLQAILYRVYGDQAVFPGGLEQRVASANLKGMNGDGI